MKAKAVSPSKASLYCDRRPLHHQCEGSGDVLGGGNGFDMERILGFMVAFQRFYGGFPGFIVVLGLGLCWMCFELVFQVYLRVRGSYYI